MAEATYDANRAGRRMRKFGIQYARLHPQAQAVRDAFIAVHRPGQWQEVLARWYVDDAPGRYPSEVIREEKDFL